MKLGVVEHSTAEQDGHVARRSDRLQEFTLNRHWIARNQWRDELAAVRFVAICNEGNRLAGCDDGRHLPSGVSDRWSEPHRYGSNDCVPRNRFVAAGNDGLNGNAAGVAQLSGTRGPWG